MTQAAMQGFGNDNAPLDGSNSLDGNLYVKFYKQAIESKAKSLEEGRPIFVEVDYISIIVPGDATNQIERKATENDKQRFYKQWSNYERSGEGDGVSGTPIDEWPAIPLAQKAALKAMSFMTVEMLASASDMQLQKIGMGAFELRTKAKAFLEASAGSAEAQKYAVENERLKNDIVELQRQVAELARPKTRKPRSK